MSGDDVVLINPFLSVLKFDVSKTRPYTFAATLGDAKLLPKAISDAIKAAVVTRANVCGRRWLACGWCCPGPLRVCWGECVGVPVKATPPPPYPLPHTSVVCRVADENARS